MTTLFLVGLFTTFIIMFSAWIWYLVTKNPAIIDFNWVLGLGLLPFIYLYNSGVTPTLSQWIIVGMVSLWALRLGTYLLLTRVLTKANDTRYLTIWQNLAWPMWFKILMQVLLQTILQWIISFAYISTFSIKHDIALPILIFGMTVFVIGFFIESIADHQLFYFRKKASNKGAVCEIGLWRYSRHPNLFGEWLIWIGISLTAVQFELFPLALLSSLMMWIIMRVMTIPITEKASLNSKPQKYAEYQKNVPYVMVPWFRKK